MNITDEGAGPSVGASGQAGFAQGVCKWFAAGAHVNYTGVCVGMLSYA